MRDVDVQQRVAAAVDVVARRRRAARRVPEVGPVRLVHARPRADDVEVAKGRERRREQLPQRRPRAHVRLDEEGAWRPGRRRRVLVDEGLRFGPEGEVGEDDVAVAREEQAREGEVDAWARG